jgi:hypothetical protein
VSWTTPSTVVSEWYEWILCVGRWKYISHIQARINCIQFILRVKLLLSLGTVNLYDWYIFHYPSLLCKTWRLGGLLPIDFICVSLVLFVDALIVLAITITKNKTFAQQIIYLLKAKESCRCQRTPWKNRRFNTKYK